MNYLLPINKINWNAELSHNGEVKDNQIIMRKVNGNVNSDVRAEKMNMLLQPDTSYLLIYEVVENIGGVSDVNMNDWSSSNSWRLTELNVGVHKIKITTNSKVGKGHFQFYGCGSTENNAQIIFSNLVLIPYQEGMENWDIPYFTGIQSVKMPVLKTTGKNLFDMNHASYITGLIHVSNQTINQTAITKAYYIPCEPNTSYTISKMMTQYFRICETSVVPTFGCAISNTVNNPSKASLTITTSESAKYLCFNVHNVNADTMDESEVLATLQIEKGLVATPYEPYKSNILTVNEDVALRGIGDVKDTLDLMTGEVVERIGEMVLNGSEEWSIPTNFSNGDCKAYSLSINGLTSNIVCDGLKILPNSLKYGTEEGVFVNGNLLIVKKNIATRELLKQWLSQNPITVQYQLATESVKTVDLSDNRVYSYKDVTHYDCSSAEGSLVPMLSVDVPTNLPAVVTRQRAMIQELEKENVALKTAVIIVDEHREEGDLELLSSDFDFELRLMEIEFAVGIPMTANYKGVRNMARTPYDMAKALILGGKYEREEMTIKLDRFEKLGSITADQKAELIALMDAVELTQ